MGYTVGQGIFALSNSELDCLNLSEREKQLLKPYFTSDQIKLYYTNPQNTHWVIYTDSSYRNEHSLDDYPQLKRHLDSFMKILTSDFKPYGLHRSRNEKFFLGKKVIAMRKCVGRPLFSYSDIPCYVSQTFIVIKTDKVEAKVLVGILNSTLIKFWLKNKGKMQGQNFQIDAEPLKKIPIKIPSEDICKSIIEKVDQIIKNEKIGHDNRTIQKHLDLIIYDLYGFADNIDIIENSL